MNLSSLSNADLDLLWNAVQDADNEWNSLMAGHVLVERAKRAKNVNAVQVGYRIEIFNEWSTPKWADAKDNYFGQFGLNRFFPTRAAAQVAVDKINREIKGGHFEYATEQIKKDTYRFVRVTTTREIV